MSNLPKLVTINEVAKADDTAKGLAAMFNKKRGATQATPVAHVEEPEAFEEDYGYATVLPTAQPKPAKSMTLGEYFAQDKEAYTVEEDTRGEEYKPTPLKPQPIVTESTGGASIAAAALKNMGQ